MKVRDGTTAGKRRSDSAWEWKGGPTSADRSPEVVKHSRLKSVEFSPAAPPRPTDRRAPSLRTEPRAFAGQAAAGFSRGWDSPEHGYSPGTDSRNGLPAPHRAPGK